MNKLSATLLLLAAPLAGCSSTAPGGVPYRGQEFANVRLDFNT